MQLNKPNIDVSYYSWMFIIIRQLPRKSYLDRMIGGTNNFVILLIEQTWNVLNERL